MYTLLQASPPWEFFLMEQLFWLLKEGAAHQWGHVGRRNFHDTPMRPTDVQNLNVCRRVDYCFSVIDIIDVTNNSVPTLQDIFLRLQSTKDREYHRSNLFKVMVEANVFVAHFFIRSKFCIITHTVETICNKKTLTPIISWRQCPCYWILWIIPLVHRRLSEICN